MNGYTGKLLRVDLSSGKLWTEALNEQFARQYLGGSALAARYLYEISKGEMPGRSIDPLGPDNPLIFMTGPLVGTAMPSAGRYSVCAFSPLTGLWGESNSGGFWGPELRFAGYDGIIVTGKADHPVWLKIMDGVAELHDATVLWGSDSYQTQEKIRAELGDRKLRIACIGQAGEKLVKMASVMNDEGRAAARTGMGAVMGSKNLKAIAVRGKGTIPLADESGFKACVQNILHNVKEDVSVQAIRLAGTAGYVNMGIMYGDMPVRYYQQGDWPECENLSGILMMTEYQNRNTGCYRCPIACGRETRAPAYNLAKVDGPEYETVGAFGSLPMVDDLQAVIYANHLCNQYGMDTISLGSTLALACELFERGILTAADTGGLEIRYGDAPTHLKLVEMTALRLGFGDLLAEGSAALAEHFGVPELAVTVNRLEVPLHDPRAFHGMAVTYALSPRGACHMQGDMYGVDTGQGYALELGIEPGERFDNSVEKGRVSARNQAWRSLYNALILCQFHNPGVDLMLTALNTITGWGWSSADLMEAGKRSLDLKRKINMQRGLTIANDRLPDLLLKPLTNGGTEGHVPDMQTLLAGAYDELGWDPISGAPLAEIK
jgi:aldehyde:ferredoxin oxidoreductase